MDIRKDDTQAKTEAAAETPSVSAGAAKSDAAGATAAQEAAPAAARTEPLEPSRALTIDVKPAETASSAPRKEQRSTRFALLAASVALAAAIGAVAGALGATGLERVLAAPVAEARIEGGVETQALKHTVARLETTMKSLKDGLATLQTTTRSFGDGLAALRTSLNSTNAAAHAQLAKVNEQLERIARGQVERRAALPAPAETTGSITPPPAAVVPNPALKPGIVNGWVLRKVYDGAALIEGRNGIVEIEPGSMLPGVGRVEGIRRQDGRWVVVTSRGLIVPR